MHDRCTDFLSHLLEAEPEGSYPELLSRMILEYDCFETMMDIALGGKGPLPFRASWGISTVCLTEPHRFAPHVSRFISDFKTVTHESVRREYGKTLLFLIKKQLLKLKDSEAEAIAETVCNWVTDPKAKVANKVSCLDILAILIPQVDWSREVLQELLEKEKNDASPALLNRIRKIETKLGLR